MEAVGPTSRYREQVNDQPKYPGADDQSQSSPSGSPLQGSVATATARIQVIIEAAEKAAAGIIDDAEAQARRYLEESRTRADSIAEQRAQEMSALTDSLIEQAETVKRQSDELIRALGQAKQQVHEGFGEEGTALQGTAPLTGPAEPELAGPRLAPLGQEPPSESAPVHHLKPIEPQEDFPVESLPPQEGDLPLEQVPPLNPEPAPSPPVSIPPPISSEPVSEAEEPSTPAEGPTAEEEKGEPEPPSPAEPDFSPQAPLSAPPPPTSRPAGAPPSDGARLLATQMAVAGSSRAEIESRLQNEFGIWDAGPMLDAILGREG